MTEYTKRHYNWYMLFPIKDFMDLEPKDAFEANSCVVIEDEIY